MIYVYENKYYVNVSPSIYVEVNVAYKKDTDNFMIEPTKNKIELGNNQATPISLTELKKRLLEKGPTHKEISRKDVKVVKYS